MAKQIGQGGPSLKRKPAAKRGPVRRGGSVERVSRKEMIVDATREQMLQGGTDAVTIRGVASRAGVDPALVYHYFDSKEGLLQAAQELPFDPSAMIPALLSSGRSELGTRLVRTLLTVLDSMGAQAPMSFLFRMSFANPTWEDTFRDMVTNSFITPLSSLFDEEPELSAGAAAVTLVGLIWARYVNRIAPIAGADAEQLSCIFGPKLGLG
ncbi:MAG: TetR/AcrR family transcriptional regulator [Acidimicrobiaceae bacterium]|nr:TetR/AcrR family transcriptional regulator [Acidimicrobiaceae bacterium]